MSVVFSAGKADEPCIEPVAIGVGAMALANYAIAIGRNAVATEPYQVVVTEDPSLLNFQELFRHLHPMEQCDVLPRTIDALEAKVADPKRPASHAEVLGAVIKGLKSYHVQVMRAVITRMNL
jgi:hypothetical protein